jgi:hypothetical protein
MRATGFAHTSRSGNTHRAELPESREHPFQATRRIGWYEKQTEACYPLLSLAPSENLRAWWTRASGSTRCSTRSKRSVGASTKI